MLKNHLEWRARIKPGECSIEDLGVGVRSGCWRYLGLGKEGTPALWCIVGRWNPHEYDVDTYQQLVAYNNHISEINMAGGATQQVRP